MSNHNINHITYSKNPYECICFFCGVDYYKQELKGHNLNKLFYYLSNYYFPKVGLFNFEAADTFLSMVNNNYDKVICEICYSNPPDIKELLFKYKMGLL